MSRRRVLCSYWYFRRAGLAPSIPDPDRWDVFADSGAFTAWTQGVKVDVDEYGDWLLENAPYINAAAGLDVIGDHVETLRNLDRLHARIGDAVPIVPAFHVGTDWPELRALCKAYPYVALGGAVAFQLRTEAMMAWCAKAHRIAAEQGAVLHGFGLTKPPYPTELPWFSIDSSYWRFAWMSGAFALFDSATGHTIRVQCGKPLGMDARRVVRSYGLDPDEMAAVGFGNVGMNPDKPKARRQYRAASVTSIETWVRYEAHLRRTGHVVAAPRGVSGDGIKIYLSMAPGKEPRWIAAATDRVEGVSV